MHKGKLLSYGVFLSLRSKRNKLCEGYNKQFYQINLSLSFTVAEEMWTQGKQCSGR